MSFPGHSGLTESKNRRSGQQRGGARAQRTHSGQRRELGGRSLTGGGGIALRARGGVGALEGVSAEMRTQGGSPGDNAA